jgi:general stress protein 26
MTEPGTPEKVAELVRDVTMAMLTFVDADGQLRSKPMATQDVDFSGDIWFIGERDSRKSRAIESDPRVNVAYAGKGSWVSVTGRAEVVDDVDRLGELWNTFTDAWLEGGPDNPNNVLIHVIGESAEYWDSPGGKVVRVANLVKAKATGKRYEGENEQVDL